MRDTEPLFLALVAAAVLAALGFDAVIAGHGWRVLAFPAALALSLGILCALRIWTLWCHRGTAEPARRHLPAVQTVRMAAGFVVILPVVAIFGFIVGLPAYVATYVKLSGEGWRTAAIAALVTLVGVLSFVQLLGIPLPKGAIAWP